MVDCICNICCVRHRCPDFNRHPTLNFATNQPKSSEWSILSSIYSPIQLVLNSLYLLEWLVASAALVVVVTLVYFYVLDRSPAPEKITQAKLEAYQKTLEVPSLIASIEDSMGSGDFRTSVDLATRAAALTLANLLAKTGENLAIMNISDLAYLVQSRSPQSPHITQHMYNLNLLRLKAAQSQQITREEAEWALSTVRWLLQLSETGQIRL